MASAFWYLEDGRGFAIRWSSMAYMLQLITDELKDMDAAKDFYNYLENLVYREDQGDEYNGYGGFIRNGEDIMFNFDLRSFAPQNRRYFWQATQKALTKLKVGGEEKNEVVIELFITLLDMHKRIKVRENPMELNHLIAVIPHPKEKRGPGW